MNNSIIYTPYLYHICWSKTNIHYIGVEYKQTAHPDNLWSKYFTSSEYVKAYREENGEPDIIKVRKIFNSAKEALCYENKILTRVNASKNDRFLNASNGFISSIDNTGKVVVKDSAGNTLSVSVDDPRYLSGELVGITTGMVPVKDTDGNTLSVSVNDPRYLSGELTSVNIGRAIVKDKDGNTLSVSVNDPRYLSGELVAISTGMVGVKDKDGNTLSVSVDDPRYLSGELVAISTGMVAVKDKDGNALSVSVNDPRYLSGELVGICSGTVAVVDKNGYKMRVSKDDPRFLSGELVGHTVGYSIYKDFCGNKVYAKTDDTRVLNGSLVNTRLKKIMTPHACFICYRAAAEYYNVTYTSLASFVGNNKPIKAIRNGSVCKSLYDNESQVKECIGKTPSELGFYFI